jgi:hypothetical protein
MFQADEKKRLALFLQCSLVAFMVLQDCNSLYNSYKNKKYYSKYG